MTRFVKRLLLIAPLVALMAIVVGLPSVALGQDDSRNFSARFLGINEVPSVSTDATASVRLTINGSGDSATIDYTLTFANLRAAVTQSHIHFGQARTNGGVAIFLCQVGQANAPAGTPSCGTNAMSGTITGHLTSANVLAVLNPANQATQGIAAGEMGRVVQAIRDGAAYANVHSAMFPGGEARGQLVRGQGQGQGQD